MTRDDAAFGASSVLIRLALELDGAATGLAVLEAQQRLSGAPPRTWDASALRGPAGFEGTVTPEPFGGRPQVIFTAVAAASAEELAACDEAPWDRPGGTLDLTVRTDQTGEVAVTCSLDHGFGGRGPEPLRVACASGVPGWLGPNPSLSDVTDPVVFRFMDSELLAHNSGAAPLDGLVGSSAHVQSRYGAFPGETQCGDPTEWTATTGTHQLWRGTSSTETWSGPVAPGAEERANWMWQEPGELPSGFCFPPSSGPPEDECLRPTLIITLAGASSVGPWSWESDFFDCLEL